MEKHTCRVYKGIEYYGRNINYLGKHVVVCDKCGFLGVHDSNESAEEAKNSHMKEQEEKGI